MLFTQETLPVGSVINVMSGYQYRLEGWQTLNTPNNQGRLNTTTADMIVDEELYTKYTYIGFNVSKVGGAAVTIFDLVGFRIYVPKAIQE